MNVRRLVVPPVDEPVSLAEAKLHLRVDWAKEDLLILRCVSAARQWAEAFTRRAFMTQTWEMYLDRFPAVIELPLPPLQSVAAITCTDAAGALSEVPVETYLVDTVREPGRVLLSPGRAWPQGPFWRVNPIVVRFVAGKAEVDADIKSAVLLLVGHMYEHREEGQEKIIRTVPFAAKTLLTPHIAGWF